MWVLQKGIIQNKNLKNLQVLQNNWHVGQKQINNPEQQFEEQLSRMANCKTCKTMHKTPICVYCNKSIESNILQIIVALPLCRAII